MIQVCARGRRWGTRLYAHLRATLCCLQGRAIPAIHCARQHQAASQNSGDQHCGGQVLEVLLAVASRCQTAWLRIGLLTILRHVSPNWRFRNGQALQMTTDPPQTEHADKMAATLARCTGEFACSQRRQTKQDKAMPRKATTQGKRTRDEARQPTEPDRPMPSHAKRSRDRTRQSQTPDQTRPDRTKQSKASQSGTRQSNTKPNKT